MKSLLSSKQITISINNLGSMEAIVMKGEQDLPQKRNSWRRSREKPRDRKRKLEGSQNKRAKKRDNFSSRLSKSSGDMIYKCSVLTSTLKLQEPNYLSRKSRRRSKKGRRWKRSKERSAKERSKKRKQRKKSDKD